MKATELKIGDAAPGFTLPAHEQGEIRLSDFHGKYVVLYFYPRDNTPGCTMESCDFRDAHLDFDQSYCVILGVSRDSLVSHQKFSGKFDLPFTLLSDAEEIVCLAYDVIKMKNMYGKQVRGIERSTFIIDPEGKLAAIWRKVKVKGHVDDVLAKLRGLAG
ncbi:MAG: peroxiredoxin [Mariprofundaceae bacterium]